MAGLVVARADVEALARVVLEGERGAVDRVAGVDQVALALHYDFDGDQRPAATHRQQPYRHRQTHQEPAPPGPPPPTRPPLSSSRPPRIRLPSRSRGPHLRRRGPARCRCPLPPGTRNLGGPRLIAHNSRVPHPLATARNFDPSERRRPPSRPATSKTPVNLTRGRRHPPPKAVSPTGPSSVCTGGPRTRATTRAPRVAPGSDLRLRSSSTSRQPVSGPESPCVAPRPGLLACGSQLAAPPNMRHDAGPGATPRTGSWRMFGGRRRWRRRVSDGVTQTPPGRGVEELAYGRALSRSRRWGSPKSSLDQGRG